MVSFRSIYFLSKTLLCTISHYDLFNNIEISCVQNYNFFKLCVFLTLASNYVVICKNVTIVVSLNSLIPKLIKLLPIELNIF